METSEFDTRLKELSAMCGSDRTDVLFNQSYEELLTQVKADPDKTRQRTHAERLRRLANYQTEFLTNEWLRLNRLQGVS